MSLLKPGGIKVEVNFRTEEMVCRQAPHLPSQAPHLAGDRYRVTGLDVGRERFTIHLIFR